MPRTPVDEQASPFAVVPEIPIGAWTCLFLLDVYVCVNITVKFNIVSMETQTQMYRMGLNPFLTFYIHIMLNVDANVKCEQAFSRRAVSKEQIDCAYACLIVAPEALTIRICYRPRIA